MMCNEIFFLWRKILRMTKCSFYVGALDQYILPILCAYDIMVFEVVATKLFRGPCLGTGPLNCCRPFFAYEFIALAMSAIDCFLESGEEAE